MAVEMLRGPDHIAILILLAPFQEGSTTPAVSDIFEENYS